MKTIKKIINADPETLHENEILKIISLRLMDVSSGTRESTLDLLWNCLTKVGFENDEKAALFEKQFILKYLPIIMERADDANLGIRKRVV